MNLIQYIKEEINYFTGNNYSRVYEPKDGRYVVVTWYDGDYKYKIKITGDNIVYNYTDIYERTDDENDNTDFIIINAIFSKIYPGG